jgi:hypothetical protein
MSKIAEDYLAKFAQVKDPLNSQVGGSHYKKYKIQPVEYAMANNLNYCQANAVKYITRYRDKNGIEDLRKAIHNIEILIALEEREVNNKEDISDQRTFYFYGYY